VRILDKKIFRSKWLSCTPDLYSTLEPCVIWRGSCFFIGVGIKWHEMSMRFNHSCFQIWCRKWVKQNSAQCLNHVLINDLIHMHHDNWYNLHVQELNKHIHVHVYLAHIYRYIFVSMLKQNNLFNDMYFTKIQDNLHIEWGKKSLEK
jgi:hypothetical protein